ncbi:MAG: NBR1-Ig-like domain-containing protein [Anaerolineales bacterium]|nr:NBR1-Ig-like domain-containing protein [Anaerolineales bacterium]
MAKKNLALSIVIVAMLVSSACVLTIPVPGFEPPASVPSPGSPTQFSPLTSPGALIPTFTLVLTDTPAPTFTPSFTPTFFPTITPLPTATITPSITLTPVPVQVATLGSDVPQETLTQMALTPLSSGDPPGSEYACVVTARRIADLTVFKPGYRFTAWWDIRNVGRKKWQSGVVLASLVEGMKLSEDRFYELPSEPKPGESLRLRIEIKTPPDEGTYLTTWGLRVTRTGRHFCFFTLNIIVKK